MSAREGIEQELFQEFATRLGAALEAMAGETPTFSWDPLPSAPERPTLQWKQPFTGLAGAILVAAAEKEWVEAGRIVLHGAGIDDAEPAEYKSTYLEIINQALAGVAQAFTSKLGHEVIPSNGAESQEANPAKSAGESRWVEINIRLGESSFALSVGADPALLAALGDTAAAVTPAESATPVAPPTVAASSGASGAAVAPAPLPNPSKTFDLLLDVELPVSVSFGRAQILLKDVLKLATGSIVELNRSILEPVEIIVNNCVIARGEVVVVEGNFGVRIQEVISRQERLRTLQ